MDNDATNNGYFDRVKGLLTGSKSLLQDGTNSNWICKVSYYDDKYRPIQEISTMIFSGSISLVSTRYDFTGNVLETLETQTIGAVVNKFRQRMEYDHAGRVLHTNVYFNNNDPVCISMNNYNELGELSARNLHSVNQTTFLQSVNYTYNIRGWLTQINDPEDLSHDNDGFGMNLFYEEPDAGLNISGQYNGNISGSAWRYGNDDTLRAYAYSYDALNRILSANHQRALSGNWTDNDKYDVGSIAYDLNGNIKTLSRKDMLGNTLDNLSYDYINDGNQLEKVSDSSNNPEGFYDGNTIDTDYLYDQNGNMTTDKNKGIKIDYNYLNLPERVYPETTGSDQIRFIYDASGTKWQKTATASSVTDTTTYAGNFVYKGTGSGLSLEYVLTPEGMIRNPASPEYHYFIKDLPNPFGMGNTRATITDADHDGVLDFNSSEILQTADYYPFGMMHYGQGGTNKYLYNGKELQEEGIGGVGLDWYDYGARFYDPASDVSPPKSKVFNLKNMFIN